ncbi:MAG: hypothetical protein AMXMBFR53_32120 [Gemmatimonadota bacterium]
MMPFFFVLAFLFSFIFPIVGIVAVVTYIRRTRRLEQMETDGSLYGRVLDGLDQIDMRLDAINERLARIEDRERLTSGESHEVVDEGDGD